MTNSSAPAPGSVASELFIGDFEVETRTASNPDGLGALKTLLHLELAQDGRIVGEERDQDPDPAKVSRWPVEKRGNTLFIGKPESADGQSEYVVLQVSMQAFSGTWRTRQPAWLREKQPGHPEFATGEFFAQRRRVAT